MSLVNGRNEVILVWRKAVLLAFQRLRNIPKVDQHKRQSPSYDHQHASLQGHIHPCVWTHVHLHDMSRGQSDPMTSRVDSHVTSRRYVVICTTG